MEVQTKNATMKGPGDRFTGDTVWGDHLTDAEYPTE